MTSEKNEKMGRGEYKRFTASRIKKIKKDSKRNSKMIKSFDQGAKGQNRDELSN